MKRVLLLVALLGGCASQPETIIETVRVEVPVIVPCPVDFEVNKVYATDVLSIEDSDFDKIRALLVERRQRMADQAELQALLEACTKPLNEQVK